jgi:hypothetical protein
MPQSQPSPSSALPRPRRRWPLVLFILLAIGAVAATVLLANDRKNLVKLAEFLGMPPSSASTGAIPVVKPVPVVSQATSPNASPQWPWLHTADTGRLQPAPSSSDMCKAQAERGQEKPAYAASPERGWECSMLRDGLGDTEAASLFLQGRGNEKMPADAIRIKFNLAGGPLANDLADQALAFLHASTALEPNSDLDEALRTKLTEQTDFYFIAGYQALTFRREMGDHTRYNLIGLDISSVEGRPSIMVNDTADEEHKVVRGSRVLTLPAGND